MMILSILGALLHVFLALSPKNPLYLYQKIKLYSQKILKIKNNQVIHENEDEKPEREFENNSEGKYEPGIQVRKIRKIYKTGFFNTTTIHALKNITIDFYKNKISVILGNNGAGKSALLSILSGTNSPSKGTFLMNEKNMNSDKNLIKKNVNICHQKNIYFSDLNVYQQLLLLGNIKYKNETFKEIKNKIDTILSNVGLIEKKNSYPHELSGGMKKKLCLAIALIGDKNYLILDEPTSGLDAESKRDIWDVILKLKNYKTIIMSTHDTEEAKILGDKIAIIQSGEIKSYGSLMYLKNKYNNGNIIVTISHESGYNLSNIMENIKIPMKQISMEKEKIVFELPLVESLPETLDKLEKNSEEISEIRGMNVSTASIEQIFSSITGNNEKVYPFTINTMKKFTKNHGIKYFFQTFIAYSAKKLAYIKNNPVKSFTVIFLPSLIVGLLLQSTSIPDNKPIDFSLSLYSPSISFIDSSRLSKNQTIFLKMFNKFIENNGARDITSKSNHNITNELLNYANKNGIKNYEKKSIISAEFKTINDTNVHINILYSRTAIRNIPIALNCLSNTILKSLTNNENMEIKISSQPLMKETNQLDNNDYQMLILMTTMTICLFLIPTLSLYLIQPYEEEISGIKKLQDMTGASKITYWLSMFIIDFIQYTLSICLFIAVLVVFDNYLNLKMYQFTEISVLFGFLIVFGMSILSQLYVVCLFKIPKILSIVMFIILPFIIPIIDIIIFQIMVLKIDRIIFLKKILIMIRKYFIQPIPQLNLIYGLWQYFTIVKENSECRCMTSKQLLITCNKFRYDPCCSMQCSDGYCKNQKSYLTTSDLLPTIFECVEYMVISFVIYISIMIIIELRVIPIIQSILKRLIASLNGKINTIDDDEISHRERIIINNEIKKREDKKYYLENKDKNILLINNLRKKYGNSNVINNICLRVGEKNVLGLLGVNGAGKSTMFKILTGLDNPDEGIIYLKQYGLHNNRRKYLSEIGYCPQQTILIDSLNAWDHLYLFARLRGIPSDRISEIVKTLINMLNLNKFAQQKCKTYSGGNKRRLSMAIALIGNPSLILMDEPTAGVDLYGKRLFCNIINNCQINGQAVLFTSHSMEECENICNNIVIIKNGKFICRGIVDELKKSLGYNIRVKLASNFTTNDIDERIKMNFNCKVVDEKNDFICYYVSDCNVTWREMFGVMNDLKNNYFFIENFEIYSSTLEQLFISCQSDETKL